MTFIKIYYLFHDLPYYAMIIIVIIFYVMICYGNQLYNLPLPPPLHFHSNYGI